MHFFVFGILSPSLILLCTFIYISSDLIFAESFPSTCKECILLEQVCVSFCKEIAILFVIVVSVCNQGKNLLVFLLVIHQKSSIQSSGSELSVSSGMIV